MVLSTINEFGSARMEFMPGICTWQAGFLLVKWPALDESPFKRGGPLSSGDQRPPAFSSRRMSLLKVRIRLGAEGFTTILGRSKSLYFRTMYGFHKEPAATN
jgi:hypothetical protein